ncbi:MAG: phosphoribosyl-ATP diphosphatase [Halobacteriota archaeon]
MSRDDDADFDLDVEVIAELYDVIESRREASPEESYTAVLLDDVDNVLEKIGEESTEVVLAAKDDDPEALAHESADLVYHLLVLMAATDVGFEATLDTLRDRRESERRETGS